MPEDEKRFSNPLDWVEQVVYGYDWSCERVTRDELSVQVQGECTDYTVFFSWLEEQEALHLACCFPFSVPLVVLPKIQELLSQINSKLLIGHFDYWNDAQKFIYRQSLLLSGGLYPSYKQIERLLALALESCEGHYNAFRMVASSVATPRNALSYSLFETIGTA